MRYLRVPFISGSSPKGRRLDPLIRHENSEGVSHPTLKLKLVVIVEIVSAPKRTPRNQRLCSVVNEFLRQNLQTSILASAYGPRFSLPFVSSILTGCTWAAQCLFVCVTLGIVSAFVLCSDLHRVFGIPWSRGSVEIVIAPKSTPRSQRLWLSG